MIQTYRAYIIYEHEPRILQCNHKDVNQLSIIIKSQLKVTIWPMMKIMKKMIKKKEFIHEDSEEEMRIANFNRRSYTSYW